MGDRGIVVIGTGNPMRGDDGVGRRVARLLRPRLPSRVTVRECEGEATELMDAWTGFAHAVVVDAARGGGAPGTLHRVEVVGDALPEAVGGISSHGLGLAEAVALGRALDRMPGRLVVCAIVGRSFETGSGLSAEVESAVERTASLILDEVDAPLGACGLRED